MLNNVILFFHILILCATPSVYIPFYIPTASVSIVEQDPSLNALPMVSSFFSCFFFFPFYL